MSLTRRNTLKSIEVVGNPEKPSSWKVGDTIPVEAKTYIIREIEPAEHGKTVPVNHGRGWANLVETLMVSEVI